MKLEQTFEVDAPLERVWEALIHVDQVAPCLPGATITEAGEDGVYEGTFSAKVGPASVSFKGTLKMEEVDEATHTAKMLATNPLQLVLQPQTNPSTRRITGSKTFRLWTRKEMERNLPP